MKSIYTSTILFSLLSLLFGISRGAYNSMKDIPKKKVGFSEIDLLKGNSRPLYYIDINNDKM